MLDTKFINFNSVSFLEHCFATAAAVVSRSFIFVITLYSSQVLSPDEFGIFMLVLLLSNCLAAIVSGGGDMWLNRFNSYSHTLYHKPPAITRYYLQSCLMLAALVIVCAGISAGYIVNYKVSSSYFAISFGMVWAAFTGMTESCLSAFRSVRDLKYFFFIRDFLTPFVTFLGTVILGIKTAADFFLISGIITSFSAVLIMYALKNILKINIFTGFTIPKKGILLYTLSLVINNFTARLANSVDSLLLGWLMPLSVVGKYRMGAHFSNAFVVVQHFVFLALPWQLRSSVTPSLEEESNQELNLRNNILIISCILALILLIGLAKPGLQFLGEQYENYQLIFCIFLMMRFSEVLWGPQHEILISNNKIYEDTLANIVAIVMSLIVFGCGFNLLPPLSNTILSAGIGSLTAQIIRFLFLKRYWYSSKRKKFPGTPYFPALLMSAILMVYFCI